MCIALSALFGLQGRYNFCGIDINFTSREPEPNILEEDPSNVFGEGLFAKTANCLLRNPVIKLASFGYLHVFIHEMGHALASKLCGDRRPSINVYTKPCRGTTIHSEDRSFCCDRFVTLAGPILSTLWEVAKLIAAIALIIFLPPPIGLPLGIFLGAGSAFWLFGEIAYAFSRNGDWKFLR